MQQVKRAKENNFTDVIKKIQRLTSSQRKLVADMLKHREKVSKASKKKLLQKSFGIWADRQDIGDSREYVSRLRKSWDTRLKRIKA